MKRAIIILMVALLSGVAFGQTVINGGYKTFAGTTADTLYASSTKTYTLDFGASGAFAGKVFDYTIELFADYTSGTTTGYFKVWESLDGTNFPATAADSLLVTSAADRTYLYTKTSSTARYVKISMIPTSATQSSRLYGYVSAAKHYNQ